MNPFQTTYNFNEQPTHSFSDFRIIKSDVYGDNQLSIHQLFYDMDGELLYYTDIIELKAPDLESLIKNMRHYAQALERDVLSENDLLQGKVVYVA